MNIRYVILILVVFFLVGIAGCDSSSDTLETSPVEVQDNNEDIDLIVDDVSPVAEQITIKTVTITSNGFQPSLLQVKVGETVVFVNQDSTKHWPASAVHPTHNKYPGSGINKCGSFDPLNFDACKGLAQGESFSFIFNEKGTWGYHDHLKAGLQGTIVVS